MNYKEKLESLSTMELEARRVQVERKIEENSGRLTPGDSDWLDEYLDQRDAIDEVLKDRQAL